MFIPLVISAYLFFIALNIGMADLHHNLILKAIDKKTKAISHGWWALLYATLCAIPAYLFHSYYLFGALGLIHLSVFPVAFNRYQGLDDYHLSATTTAITDRAMRWIGLKDTKIVNYLAELIGVAFLITSCIIREQW